MTPKEKFLQLVSNEETNTVARAKARQQSRAYTRLSQQIALAILERLDVLNWNQKKLAETMGVSPQQVNKWVKGGENFKLETLTNLEAVLNTSLISVQLQEPKFQRAAMVTTTSPYKNTAVTAVIPIRITNTRVERQAYAKAN